MTDATQDTATAPTGTPTLTPTLTTTEAEAGTAPLAEGELVEEVSIDGMCGVY